MNVVFGLIFAIIICYIGFKLANKFYLRKIFFDNFINFLEYLQSNLSFQGDNLLAVFSDYSHTNNDFGEVIQSFIKYRQDNTLVDISEELRKLSYLMQNDITQIQDFLKNFGTVDKDTQLEQIHFTLDWARQRQTFTQSECIQKGKMYRTLSVMLGLVIFVIYI